MLVMDIYIYIHVCVCVLCVCELFAAEMEYLK
jgi:hypothetical protein